MQKKGNFPIMSLNITDIYSINFKICIDKMIFWVYNMGGWAGIDNKDK